MINNQALVFLIFSLNGVIIGLFFDFFRILRKSFKTSNLITYIQDILFWILTGISIICSMYNFSDGTIRLFMIIGLILGFLFYILTLSTYIIKLFVFLINIIRAFIISLIRIFYIPISRFSKILFNKIFKFLNFTLFSNIKQIFTKYTNKIYSKNVKKNIK